jgi:hypothetical protein
LTITPDQVSFSTSGQETAHRSAGLDARGRAVLVELAVSRARPGGAPLRAAAAGAAQAGMHAGLVQAVNNRAGHCFLHGSAGQTLPAEVAAATAGNAALRLAVDVRMRPARAAVGDGGAAGAGDAAGAAGRGARCTAPPY